MWMPGVQDKEMKACFKTAEVQLFGDDCRNILPTMNDESIDCCVTSPPYWQLRDYGMDTQIGLEESIEQYVAELVNVFEQVKRVLKKEGTLWLNLGDTYSPSNTNRKSLEHGSRRQYKTNATVGMRPIRSKINIPAKNLVGIPWRVAFELQKAGWILRQDIIWNKPNAMPESVKDRCTKSHEYIFLLSKSKRYYFDNEAIKEPGERKYRNKRSVWNVTTKPFKDAHFAVFPKDLITPCVVAGCPPGGTVLDPFSGTGTTGLVATENGRKYIGIELNSEYIQMAIKQLRQPHLRVNTPSLG